MPEELKGGFQEKILHGKGYQALAQLLESFLQGFNSSVHLAPGDVVSGGLGSAGDGWIQSERAFPEDSMVLTLTTLLLH